MTAWYNDTDPFSAEWLRQLIKTGHVAPGVVDERDIRNISPHDLKDYTQLHFFAGIGGWSLALRQAGWPDDRPVWTGSCPCQPFSGSGKGQGFDDDRHLWPAWASLIAALKPAVLFGEQVASPAALNWIDLVSADLENAGYAVGTADLCAAGLSAAHIRQRLWFGAVRGLAHADGTLSRCGVQNVGAVSRAPKRPSADQSSGSGHAGWMADTNGTRSQGWARKPGSNQRPVGPKGLDHRQAWTDPDWIWCRDERWRPTEPGLCPLADGVPGRVGRLRAYGNAIVPQVAATFIHAFDQSF